MRQHTILHSGHEYGVPFEVLWPSGLSTAQRALFGALRSDLDCSPILVCNSSSDEDDRASDTTGIDHRVPFGLICAWTIG